MIEAIGNLECNESKIYLECPTSTHVAQTIDSGSYPQANAIFMLFILLQQI